MGFIPQFNPLKPLAAVGLAIATCAAAKYGYDQLSDQNKTKAKIAAFNLSLVASAYVARQTGSPFWVGPGLVALGVFTTKGIINAPLYGKVAIVAAVGIPTAILFSPEARLGLLFWALRIS